MVVTKSNRGFEQLKHAVYVERPESDDRLAAASSVIGDYPDAFERPGTSALWIGQEHHLNREEVAEFVKHLNNWLETGRLEVADGG